jgi:hypothetical protein
MSRIDHLRLSKTPYELMPPEDDSPKSKKVTSDLDPAVTESAVIENIFYLDRNQR